MPIDPIYANMYDLEKGLDSQRQLFQSLLDFSMSVESNSMELERKMNELKRPSLEELIQAIAGSDLYVVFHQMFTEFQVSCIKKVEESINNSQLAISEMQLLKKQHRNEIDIVLKREEHLIKQVEMLRRQVHFFGLPDTIKTDEGYHFAFIKGKWVELPTLSLLFENESYYTQVEANLWVKLDNYEVVALAPSSEIDTDEDALGHLEYDYEGDEEPAESPDDLPF